MQGNIGMTQKSVQKISTLAMMANELFSVLGQIDKQQEIIGASIDRLVNPRPPSVAPPANINSAARESHETTLREIKNRLEQILSRATDQADSLNAAI